MLHAYDGGILSFHKNVMHPLRLRKEYSFKYEFKNDYCLTALNFYPHLDKFNCNKLITFIFVNKNADICISSDMNIY